MYLITGVKDAWTLRLRRLKGIHIDCTTCGLLFMYPPIPNNDLVGSYLKICVSKDKCQAYFCMIRIYQSLCNYRYVCKYIVWRVTTLNRSFSYRIVFNLNCEYNKAYSKQWPRRRRQPRNRRKLMELI